MENPPVFIDFSETGEREAERIANTIRSNNTGSPGISFHAQVKLPSKPEMASEPAEEVETGIEIAKSLCNDSFFSSIRLCNEIIFDAVTLFESSYKSYDKHALEIDKLKVCLHTILAVAELQDDADMRKLILLIAVLQCKSELYSEAAGYLKFFIYQNSLSLECKEESRVLKQYFDSMPKQLCSEEIDLEFLVIAIESIKTCQYYCIVEGELRARRLLSVGLIKVDRFDDGFLLLCDVLEEQLEHYSNDYHNKDVLATLSAFFDNLENLTEDLVSFKVLRRVYKLVKLGRRDVDVKWRFCEVYVRMLLSGEFKKGIQELQEIFDDEENCFRNLPASHREIQVMQAVLGRYYQGGNVKKPLKNLLSDFKKATELMGSEINNLEVLENTSLPILIIQERSKNRMRTCVKNMTELALNALHQLKLQNKTSASNDILEILKMNNKGWTVLYPNDPYLFVTAKAVTIGGYLMRGKPSFSEARIIKKTVSKFKENLGSDHPLHVRALIHELHVDVKLIRESGKVASKKLLQKLLRNCNTAVELAEQVFGNCHEETASAKLILGQALATDGKRREDAANCIHEAAKIMEETVGPFWKNPMAYNHWKRVAHTLENVGEVESALRYAGKWREAVKRYPPDSKAQKAINMVKRLEEKVREME